MEAKEWVEGREKLVATPSQFETMLSRNCDLSLSPEVKLVLAILRQAAADAQEKYREYLRSYIPKITKNKKGEKTERFSPMPVSVMLDSEELSFWISGNAGIYGQLIGLDPDFLFEQFRDHLGIDIETAKTLSFSQFDAELRGALSLGCKVGQEETSTV